MKVAGPMRLQAGSIPILAISTMLPQNLPILAKVGRPCREARIDATINGKPETVVTTACRAEDGMWELQK